MNKTVLIIDDDPIIRIILQKMIQIVDASAICYQFENGEVGLSYLKNLKSPLEHLIVLLDINMPVLDAWGFLDELQKISLKSIDNLQFYIVTSSTDESDRIKSQSYPAIIKFYTKPLSKQDVIDILNS
ncbi:MAG: response regulator [Balneolales bacterium]|nr:response regulator [Balneolales bacterium]